MNKLTEKQKKFAREYLLDLNGTQAAIRAGYSKKSAARISVGLLNKSHVAEYVAKLKASRCERTDINADYVLNRIVEIDQLDVADILTEEGYILPIKQWPKVWRTTISAIDVQEMISGDEVGIIKKIKFPDKVKNIELLGKHVDVQAFKDNIKVEGEVDLVSPLLAARKRLEKR